MLKECVFPATRNTFCLHNMCTVMIGFARERVKVECAKTNISCNVAFLSIGVSLVAL